MFRDQLVPSEAVAHSDRHMLARYQTSRGQRRPGAKSIRIIEGEWDGLTATELSLPEQMILHPKLKH